MSGGAYEKIEGPKAKKLIERLNKAWNGSPFDEKRTVIHARPLPFAQGWILAEASDAMTLPEKKCVILDNGSDCYPVEYGPDFIPKFAANQNIRLSSSTVTDYLRFWFEYTRTGADRFLLVENIDDIPWREEPTPQARKALAKTVMPLTLTGTTPNGFALKATILFRDTLYDAMLEVKADGQVAITSRETIAESLTVIDTFTGF